MPRLSKRAVDALQPTDGKARFLWDGELKGFGCRVTENGVKSWICQYKTSRVDKGGRTIRKRVTIGRTSLYTPEEARKEARRILMAADLGEDPRPKVEVVTLASVAEDYLAERAEQLKPRTLVNYRYCLDQLILPDLGRVDVRKVDREQIAAAFVRWTQRGKAASNRAIGFVSIVLNHAEARGLRPMGSNPCRLIKRHKEVRHDRFLTLSELQRLGAAIEAERKRAAGLPSTLDCLEFLALTGMRKTEATTMRWSYVDLERGIVDLPDTKTGPQRKVLGADALALLLRIGPGHPHELVFPGRGGNPLTGLNFRFKKLLEEAGIPHARVHDLRHSAASVAVQSGVSMPIIGGVLSQTNQAVTARYSHLADDPVRQGADIIGSRIAAALRGEADTNEVPFKKKGA